MKKLAFKMKLMPNCKEEYKRRHDEIWPELKKLLLDAGISEYFIFLDEESNTLFAFQSINGTTGSQDLRDQEIVKKWWAYMADLMETNADLSPVSTELSEVFRLEAI